MVTDNRTAFVAFNYANTRNLPLPALTVGFFGNRKQFANVPITSLELSNLFRVDGKILHGGGASSFKKVL